MSDSPLPLGFTFTPTEMKDSLKFSSAWIVFKILYKLQEKEKKTRRKIESCLFLLENKIILCYNRKQYWEEWVGVSFNILKYNWCSFISVILFTKSDSYYIEPLHTIALYL